VLIGVGVPLIVPALLTVVGRSCDPYIKGGLRIVDAVQEVIVEGPEQLSALIAEVKAEHAAVANLTAA
jgi:hypothetical protein